jgi:hypothetical protein
MAEKTMKKPFSKVKPSVSMLHLVSRLGGYLATGAVLAAACWAVHIHRAMEVLPYDDGYITFRYVDNLLNGRGLVYNVGERVFGSSTPLYTLVLAGARMIVDTPTPELAVRMNMIPFIACGIGTYLLIRRYTGNHILAAAGTVAFLVDPILLTISSGGMESYMFLGLVLFAMLVMSVQARPIVAGVLIGLATLTRPEGVLLAPVAAWAFRRSVKNLVLSAAAAVAVGLPWIVFATAYYGTPIPLSLVAKCIPVYPLPPGKALSDFISCLESWTTNLHWDCLRQMRTVIVMDAVLLGTIACLWWRPYRQRGAWMPVAFFWLIFLLYAIGNPLLFEWYVPAFLGVSLIILTTGLPATGHLLHRALSGRHWPRLARAAEPAMVAVAMLWLAVTTVERHRQTGQGLDAALFMTNTDPIRLRVRAYEKAAKMLNKQTTPSMVIAAPEVGSLGYYSNARILDACGLVSPEVHPYLPVPDNERARPDVGAIGIQMVEKLAPDYVVSMEIFCYVSLDRSSWFKANYELVQKVPLPERCWDSDNVLIFKRIPSVPVGNVGGTPPQ